MIANEIKAKDKERQLIAERTEDFIEHGGVIATLPYSPDLVKFRAEIDFHLDKLREASSV